MTGLFEGVGIALSSLRAHKLRAALTILGVAIGVTVVMVNSALISGFKKGVSDMLASLGPKTFWVGRYWGGQNDQDPEDPERLKSDNAFQQRLGTVGLVCRAGDGGRRSIICRPLPSRIADQSSEWFIAASGARPDSDIQRSRSHEVIAISARNSDPGTGAASPRDDQGINISAVIRGWSAPK